MPVLAGMIGIMIGFTFFAIIYFSTHCRSAAIDNGIDCFKMIEWYLPAVKL